MALIDMSHSTKYKLYHITLQAETIVQSFLCMISLGDVMASSYLRRLLYASGLHIIG